MGSCCGEVPILAAGRVKNVFGSGSHSAVRGFAVSPLGSFLIFSKRELTFTFAIVVRPSVCRLSVWLSYVCNVRAPYSGD